MSVENGLGNQKNSFLYNHINNLRFQLLFMMLKNVAGSSFDEINLENGFRILEFQNESEETLTFERNIDSTFIQMHFCIKGNSKFLFNNGNYTFDVLDKRSIILYNPQRSLPINLEISGWPGFFVNNVSPCVSHA